MNAVRKRPQGTVRVFVSVLAVLTTSVALLGTRASSVAAATPLPQAASLRLSAAPIELLYPEEWRDWALNLASYADVAADDIRELIGVPLTGGVIRWQPAAQGPGSGADGVVEVTAESGTTVVTVRTNVPLLLQDFGSAHAMGYARWLAAYVVARVALGAPQGTAPWWTEGAALYITHRLFQNSRTTTPILYGIESNFVRAAQSGRPVDLSPTTLSDAARGKSFATFKLLEALYGADDVARAIGALVNRQAVELATVADAFGNARVPDPNEMLRSWLEPTVSIDVGLERVSLRDNDGTIRGRLTRRSPIALPVTVDARCADGRTTSTQIAAGSDNADFEFAVPCAPVAIIADPASLLPDVNRSNNRHGFGDAANVRRFFAFDERFSVGEMQFSRQVLLDDAQERSETFQLRITNRSDRATGVGVLVSAAWVDRPERVQRAFFVNLGPAETRIIEESMAYPNRGTGHAQVEARFWEAGNPDDLTERILNGDPGALNAYVVYRDAPDAPRRPRRGIYSQPPQITEAAGTLAEPEEDPGSARVVRSSSADNGAALSTPAPAAPTSAFGVRFRSPTTRDLPIGDTQLAVDVTGPDGAERVDFFVNDRRIGSVTQEPYRVPYTFPDDESVFVIRAVAISGDRVASTDVVLDSAAVAFGSTVNLVTIHATARDAQGRLVRDLTADDFRVIEDGRAQEIAQFEFGEVPISAALMLDQSSSMMGGGIRSERAGAKRLVDALVNDINRAMILGFNSRVWLYADFTNDKSVLEEALTLVKPDGSTALFDTLAEAVRKLNRRTGKRALVVLSDGLDTNSAFAFEDVLEFLRQSEVLVYTIGVQLMHEGTALGDASGAVRQGIEQLRAMADATGGAAYFPLALVELEEIYGLIADELSSQYALSYYPGNQSFDGRWRPLSVEVPGRPGVWVQVREGYYGVDKDGR